MIRWNTLRSTLRWPNWLLTLWLLWLTSWWWELTSQQTLLDTTTSHSLAVQFEHLTHLDADVADLRQQAKDLVAASHTHPPRSR